MIICFSGTGNTALCARELASLLDERVIMADSSMLRHPQRSSLSALPEDRRVIWAFPTYGWLIPPVVERLMRLITIDGAVHLPHYMLTTCGDDMGTLARGWRELMAERGWTAASAYAVRMPNTYVFLPGFNVDSAEVEREKLERCPASLEDIARRLKENIPGDVLIPGAMPGVKSGVLGPVFRKFYMRPGPFMHTAACTACGVCARECPVENISMAKDGPVWGKECAFCLRCYHICPHHAVAYGRQTRGKGQYRACMKEVTRVR